MINDLITFTQAIANYALLLSCQLVLILVARKPVLRLFGAVHNYRLWLLPALWAPLYLLDWSWFQAWVAKTWVTDTIIKVPVYLMSPAMEWFPDRPSGPLPTSRDEVAVLSTTMPAIDWPLVFAGLWLAGVFTLLVRQGLAFRFFLSHVHTCAISIPGHERSAIAEHAAISTRVPLYSLAGLRTPALFGVIKPILLLPADFMTAYDSDQRHLILSHESVHLQRRDNLWNLCAWSLKLIFWFNPLAHLAYRYYRADQELSCDALALMHSTARQRNRYALTLLESFGRSGTHYQSPLLTAWGGLNTIKERTVMIKRYSQCKSRPGLFRLSLLALLLSGAGITTLMTLTLSSPTLAADATTPAIPVDRAALSATVNDATNRITNLLGEYEYEAAESSLSELRSLELNDQERFLIGRLTGDLALARGDAAAAIAAYSETQGISGLNQAQREDALLHLADAQVSGGYQGYKPALALYRQLSEMSGGRNPDYLYGIASTLHRLKEYDKALAALREALAVYEDQAPRSAYMLLWTLTPDIESKRQIHEAMVEKFNDSQDAGRLLLFTMEDGSYDPRVLFRTSNLPTAIVTPIVTPGTGRLRGPPSTTVTPGNIRFAPSTEPLEFVQPVYPEDARRKGLEGYTLLVLDLDSNGNVSNPVILDSSPGGTFDDATLTAISQFRFDPSKRETNAGNFDMVYMITYELPEQK